MKNVLLIMVSMFLFTSCGTPTYEKTILEYLQASNDEDVSNIKITEVLGIENYTVADSIKDLKVIFEKDINKEIDNINLKIQIMESDIIRFGDIGSWFYNESRVEACRQAIDLLNARRDSIKSIPFTSKYDGVDEDKVLLKFVNCKYSGKHKLYGELEQQDVFILTTDMKKVVNTVSSLRIKQSVEKIFPPLM